MSFFPPAPPPPPQPPPQHRPPPHPPQQPSTFGKSNSVFYVTPTSSSNNALQTQHNEPKSNRLRSFSNISNYEEQIDKVAMSVQSTDIIITGSSSIGRSSFGKLKSNFFKKFEKLENFFSTNKPNNKNQTDNENQTYINKRNLSNCSLDSKLTHNNNNNNYNCNITIGSNFDDVLSTTSSNNTNNKSKSSLCKIEDTSSNSGEEDFAKPRSQTHTSSNKTNTILKSSISIPCQNSSMNANAESNSKVKIVNNNLIAKNYYNDKETQIDLNKKLQLLSTKERVALQQRCYDLLFQQLEAKKAQYVSLQEDFKEMKRKLETSNAPIKSLLDIESLRSDIRHLTNEKAKLEFKISKKSNWVCSKCTCSNLSDLIVCQACQTDRDDGEIFICEHCSTKNSLFNISCTKCNSYLAADFIKEARSLSTSTNQTNRSNSGSSSSLLNVQLGETNSAGLTVPFTSNLRSSSPSSYSVNNYPFSNANANNNNNNNNNNNKNSTDNSSNRLVNANSNNVLLQPSSPPLLAGSSGNLSNNIHYNNNNNNNAGLIQQSSSSSVSFIDSPNNNNINNINIK